jgi:hypothetical protein
MTCSLSREMIVRYFEQRDDGRDFAFVFGQIRSGDNRGHPRSLPLSLRTVTRIANSEKRGTAVLLPLLNSAPH